MGESHCASALPCGAVIRLVAVDMVYSSRTASPTTRLRSVVWPATAWSRRRCSDGERSVGAAHLVFLILQQASSAIHCPRNSGAQCQCSFLFVSIPRHADRAFTIMKLLALILHDFVALSLALPALRDRRREHLTSRPYACNVQYVGGAHCGLHGAVVYADESIIFSSHTTHVDCNQELICGDSSGLSMQFAPLNSRGGLCVIYNASLSDLTFNTSGREPGLSSLPWLLLFPVHTFFTDATCLKAFSTVDIVSSRL